MEEWRIVSYLMKFRETSIHGINHKFENQLKYLTETFLLLLIFDRDAIVKITKKILPRALW